MRPEPRTELETPGGTTDHSQTEAGSGTPGSTEEIFQEETSTGIDSNYASASLELLQQASLLTISSGLPERDEENTVETDQGEKIQESSQDQVRADPEDP